MKKLLVFSLITTPFALAAARHLTPRAIPVATVCALPVHMARVPAQSKRSLDPSYNVTRPTAVTAAQLNAKFRGALKGKGSLIIAECRSHKIDPLFVSGVLIHESGNGSSRYSKSYNNVAGIMKGKKPVQFKSVDDCIRYQIKLLSGKGYAGGGKQTIASIQAKYCPIKATNDPKGLNKYWQTGVLRWMKEIHS